MVDNVRLYMVGRCCFDLSEVMFRDIFTQSLTVRLMHDNMSAIFVMECFIE